MIAQQSELKNSTYSFLGKTVELEAHIQSIAGIKDQVRIIRTELG